MTKQWLAIIAFLGITFSVYSQDIKVVAQAPQIVEVGEQFEVNYNINGKPSNFIAPDMKNFQLLMGPSTGQSSQISVINGNVTQSVSYTYGYVYAANKPGKYIVGAAEATVNGKKYRSNSFTIEVVGNANARQQAQAAQNQNRPNDANETIQASNEDIFLRVNVDKKNVYNGEYLTATIKLYTRVDISQIGGINPSLNGFYVQQVELPKQGWQKENINGQVYHSALFAKYILIPQKSGSLKIDPLSLECVIQKAVKSRSRGFFDDFFSDVREVQVKLKSLPVIINVKPLPENKPESFNGAVGKFTFDAKTDKNSVKANDAITLKMTVSGTGNIKLVEAPKINFPPDFETYDPKISLNTSASNGDVSGTKTFEYLIIPRNPGKYTINPVSFSYFDIASKQYKTINTGEFNINVDKGDSTQTTAYIPGTSKEDIKFIGKDLLFIRDRITPLQKINGFFFGSILFYLIFIIGILAFVVVVFLRRQIIKQNSNKALVRNRKADKYATKRLKQAKLHLSTNEKEKFYEEIIKAVWGYLGDKLNIATSDLSRDNTGELLTNRGVEAELVQQFFDLVDSCEYARYAPVTGESSLADDYQKAINLITKLQQKLK
jgi:uncharacterized membrane protein